jgi:LemA protein
MQNIWIILAVLALMVAFLVVVYNRLVSLRLRVKEAWSDIDVQLKRRSSLIPNLVKSVQGYMQHEKSLLENITRLRTQLDSSTSPSESGKLDQQLSGALSSLKIAVENYPQLKADQTVLKLQDELTVTEDKISYSRRFYNQAVMALNDACQKFPTNLVANAFGFKQAEFFEALESEKQEVEVDLSVTK